MYEKSCIDERIKMKILILGGTGAIGYSLVDLLKCEENNIWVTSRRERANLKNVKYIVGNAMDIDFLKEILCLEFWDCIVDFMSYSEKEFRDRIDFLLDNTSQYIFLSSARVYSFDAENITELSDRLLDICDDKLFISSKDYSLEKAREENILLERREKNWTILRPYKTYSEQRLQLSFMEKENWLYRALQGRKIVFSKDIAEKYTVLSNSKDIALCIREIIGNKTTYGEVYQLVTAKAVKWKDILDLYTRIISDCMGEEVEIVWRTNAYSIWKGKPDYTIKYDSLKDHIFLNNKINNLLDTEMTNHYSSLNDGLSACLKSFLENPQFNNIDWIQEAHFDKICKQHASLKEISTLKDKIMYLLVRYTPLFYFFILARKVKYGRWS